VYFFCSSKRALENWDATSDEKLTFTYCTCRLLFRCRERIAPKIITDNFWEQQNNCRQGRQPHPWPQGPIYVKLFVPPCPSEIDIFSQCLPWLFSHCNHVRTVLSWLSSHGCLSIDVQLWLSSHGCFHPALSCLSSPGTSVTALFFLIALS
jgi:hypothetical protein